MTRPILVFGAGGRVADTLSRLVGAMLIDPSWVFASQLDCDIANEEMTRDFIASHKPRAVINLAAITLPVAEQQSQKGRALQVNHFAVSEIAHEVARHAKRRKTALTHISTDCVFSGEKREPYGEDDEVRPANYYGRTKCFGEGSIRNTAPPHIILRTTGVYLRGKPNFLETVLSKARAGETLECVSDSIYSPTDARELARAILTATERVIEDPSVSGTYHFAGPDVMSYLEFARLVQEEAGVSGEIVPVTMADREKVEGFKRPRNASLNSDKFAEVFGLRHRPTRECVRELVKPR